MSRRSIKCPFSCWRRSAASTSAPASSEQNAAIITPKKDTTAAGIKSPKENAAPTTAVPSVDGVKAPLTLEELWRQLLTHGLKEKKLDRFSGSLAYSSCAEKISDMCTEYEGKADTKFLTTIKPAVEGLLAFSQGISSLTKANKVLPLVWGNTQIFLESAKSTYSVSSNIEALLDGLKTVLPRLEDYVTLYPDNLRLRDRCRDVCEIYVEACILTILYLERRAWKNFLRGVYRAGHDARRFADAMDKLEKHERAFHYEADLASARHTKDIHAAVSGRALDSTALAES